MHTNQPQQFSIFWDDRSHSQKSIDRPDFNTDRLQTQTSGFTMSEVLVAILITTIFVSVALQGMVVAMLLKSKTLHMAEADRWVQADLERIRSQIAIGQLPYQANQLRCHPTSSDLGFADLVRDTLAGSNVTGTADYSLVTLVATSRTGKTFQIARTLSIPIAPENPAAKILGIQYTVTPTSGGNLAQPISHIYTEVMTDAALQCQ
jgi:Tfp pilus assembly protein PilV